MAGADGVDNALGAVFTLFAIIAAAVGLGLLAIAYALFIAVRHSGGRGARAASILFGFFLLMLGFPLPALGILGVLGGLAVAGSGAALIWAGFTPTPAQLAAREARSPPAVGPGSQATSHEDMRH